MTAAENSLGEREHAGPRGTSQGQPWWAGEGLRFACLGCGRCCRGESGGVFMLPDEEQRIAAALGLSVVELQKRFETSRWRFPSLRERSGGECVMHGSDGRCGIYAVRPLMCRTWPFWPELLESPHAWAEAARHCPGMNEGPLWTPEQIAAVLSEHEEYARALNEAWNKEGEPWSRAFGSC